MIETESAAMPASEPRGGAATQSIRQVLRSYFYWTFPRGSMHYDVMVTLILLFVFVSPYWINYKDRPVEHNPHRTGVVVMPDGQGGFIYQIEGRAVDGKDDDAIRSQLLSVIEPIAGEVNISNYEAVRDKSGKILAYKVWVQR